MDYFYHIAIKEIEKNQKKLTEIDERLNTAPKGGLRCERTENGYKYFHRIAKDMTASGKMNPEKECTTKIDSATTKMERDAYDSSKVSGEKTTNNESVQRETNLNDAGNINTEKRGTNLNDAGNINTEKNSLKDCKGRKTTFRYVYLGKTQLNIAKELAQKRFDRMLKKSLLKKQSSLRILLGQYPKETEADVYQRLNQGYRNLLEYKSITDNLKDWAASPYDRNTNHQEHLIQPARGGLMVRSKSEAIIAGSLAAHTLAFHYEERLILGDAELYPDFTIRHPQTGETVFWEHFGLIDNDNYARSWLYKLSKYREYGIIPGINLICTYETADFPLNPDIIEMYIELFFK